MNVATVVVRPAGWSPVSRMSDMPRTVVAALTVAATTNAWGAIDRLMRPSYLGAWQWALLAGACVVTMLTAISRPGYFRIREFRLPGVAVTALALLILAPLPGLVDRHQDRLPAFMIAQIALGLLVFCVAVLAAPTRSTRGEKPTETARWEAIVPATIVVVAILVLPIWIRSLGSIPIWQLLTGRESGIDIALTRQGALSGLRSMPLRLLVGALRNTYLMFAAGWFVADAVLNRRRTDRFAWRSRVVLGVVMCTALVYAVLTTERAIIGQVGIVAMIAALVATRRQLSARMTLALITAAIAFPLLFGLLNASGSPTAAWASVRRRIFHVPGDVMVEYFQLFPRRHPFLEGQSIPKVSRLLGGQTFDLSGYVYDVVYSFDDRLTGSANASFIGVGWANFGAVGIVIWCAVTGAALVWLERVLRRLPRRTQAALRGVACVQAVLLTSADTSRTILNVAPGFLDLLVGVWVVSWIYRTRSIRVHPADVVASTSTS